MMPRPLDLPEGELLPPLSAAIRAGVLSEEFVAGLSELAPGAPEDIPADAPELTRVQAHFHALISARLRGIA